MREDGRPKIMGFLCNWCSYAGADLSGVSRFQYPPSLRVIRVMCSTRVDPVHILRIFRAGADGVLMGGCHLGDCHYISGNYHTKYKVSMVKKLLKVAGLGDKRLRLEWISASEGNRFSQIVKEFTDGIKGLGNNPVKDDKRLQERLDAAIEAAMGQRLRTLVGSQYAVTEVENTYGIKIDDTRYGELMDAVVDEEFHASLILGRLVKGPRSVKQIANEIGVPPDRVLRHIISLRVENKVGAAGHEGMSPLYVSLQPMRYSVGAKEEGSI